MEQDNDLVRVRYQRPDALSGVVWSSLSLDGFLYDAFVEAIGGDETLARKTVREIAESIVSRRADSGIQAGLSRLVQREIMQRILDLCRKSGSA